MAWDKNKGFKGSLFDLLQSMTAYMPSPESLVEVHNWLLAQLDCLDNPWLVRFGYSLRELPGLDLKICSRIQTIPGHVEKIVLTTDNEATASFYETVREWELVKDNFGEPDLSGLFRQRCIVSGTIKHIRQDYRIPEKLEKRIRQELEKYQIRAEMLNGRHSASGQETLRAGHELKYSHIADVKPEIMKRMKPSDELRALSYRVLSPINICPTPKKSFSHSCVQIMRLRQNDIGEHFQPYMAAFVASHLFKAKNGKQAWKEYCELVDLAHLSEEKVGELVEESRQYSVLVRKKDEHSREREQPGKPDQDANDPSGFTGPDGPTDSRHGQGDLIPCLYIDSNGGTYPNQFHQDYIIWWTHRTGRGMANNSVHEDAGGRKLIAVAKNGMVIGCYAVYSVDEDPSSGKFKIRLELSSPCTYPGWNRPGGNPTGCKIPVNRLVPVPPIAP